jgi:limonene 1,2-monooxygenase
MNQRLRFGIFLAPFHKPGINPTLALQSDLDLIQWLDRCGYDEARLGEHHSAECCSLQTTTMRAW